MSEIMMSRLLSIVKPNNAQNNEVEHPVIDQDKLIDSITDRLNDLVSSKFENAPDDFENNELEDSQISEIMIQLLEFQEKYFPMIPLAEELVKKFIWNIPKPVYKAFRDARDRERDALNPILFLYLFCTDDPGYCIAKFWDVIVSEVVMPNEELIYELADSYMENIEQQEDE